MMREILEEEIEEYFGGEYTNDYTNMTLPPWFWYVFSDAGIGVDEIAYLLYAQDDLSATNLLILSREQILNASTEQIAVYAKARDAWIEMP